MPDAILRAAPVAFGAGLILLLFLFVDGLGRAAVVWAALFTAVSPAMVFYSRYFIHEMLLVFFTVLTLGAGWRYAQTRKAGWAILAGKETFVLSVGAMVLAGIVTACWAQRSRGGGSSLAAFWNWKHALLVGSAALVIWLLFFSSFFTHFGGLADSIRTYLPWLKRAGGHSPHVHPWHFYLDRLAWFHTAKGPVWSEGLILLLALVGAVVSLWRNNSPLRRFVALYTIALTALYSAISYKTPWCLLSFWHGMILLAGIGAAALVQFARATPFRAPIVGVILIFVLVPLQIIFPMAPRALDGLVWQAWNASVVYAADRRNPYVYAQTSVDLLSLVQRAEGIARVAPAGHNTVVKVIVPESDYWPLPWYLRRFKQIGWYEKLPGDPFSPIVIVSSKVNAQLDDKSDRKWIMAGLTELRPGKFLELYVELELWKKYVETLPRERD